MIDRSFLCTHEHTSLVGAVPATRFTPGFSGRQVCRDCGKVLDPGHMLGIKLWR